MENLKLAVYDFANTTSGQVFLSVNFANMSWEIFGDRYKMWKDHIGWSDTSKKWVYIQTHAIQLGETFMANNNLFIYIPVILRDVKRGLPKIEGKGRIYEPKDVNFRNGKIRWKQTTR